MDGFGADFAYTVDGGRLGEIEFENFNAASAKVTVHGVDIHPGSAKDKMRNAILLAMQYHALLPQHESPSHTEGYEGFYHLGDFTGCVETTQMRYILRDHDREKFEARKARMLACGRFLNEQYGQGVVEVEIQDSYYNMKEKLLPHMHIVERAEAGHALPGRDAAAPAHPRRYRRRAAVLHGAALSEPVHRRRQRARPA